MMHSIIFNHVRNITSNNSTRCCSKGCNNTNGIRSCSQCGLVMYCGKACQQKDWGNHKKLCKLISSYRETNVLIPNVVKYSLVNLSWDLPDLVSAYRSKYHDDFYFLGWIMMALDSTKTMWKDNIKNMYKDENEAEDILKRWGYVGPGLLEFIKEAAPGDIYETKPFAVYSPGAPQQFRNSPIAEPYKLKNGTTIFEIGFVDFGIVIDCINSLEFEGEPLTVLGYEMEPMCVAKSLVMLEMMKMSSNSSRTIVEVWMSSLWSEVTYRAFNSALQSLLASKSSKYQPEVTDILKFWKDHKKISRESALDFQLQHVISPSGSSAFAMHACSLSSSFDQVEYLRCYRTKALYDDSTTLVGSIVMNSESVRIGVKQHFGDIRESTPPFVHSKVSAPQGSPVPYGDIDPTLFGRTRRYNENQISLFARHIKNGTLIFLPKLGAISIRNTKAIEDMNAVSTNPYHVSWSNVPDYIEPQEFHKIAKAISGTETVHFLHSCNWTQRVYGTDVYDIDKRARLHFFGTGLLKTSTSHSMFTGLGATGTYQYRDFSTVALGRNYVKNFFRYFFRGEHVNCGCFNGITPLKPPTPFARNLHTAFIQFAYKETGITFKLDDYNFLANDDEK